jgi:multidrug resistance efflux pump
MPLITIDERQYELDLLSSDAKGQLASLQFVDAEIQKLQAQLAVYQTARMAYSNALKAALPKMEEVVVGS